MLPMKQVIFALLFAAAAAGPINSGIDPNRCAKRCFDNNKFDYNAKNIYLYEYMADSKSSIVGGSGDEASIRIKASVEIESTSQCDFEMRLKEVSLVDPYQAQNVRFSPYQFAKTLAKLPLRFSYQDGRIDDVCPHAEDPTWALNIKRGILSAFQNSMKRIDQDQTLIETDVTGSCDTKYTVSGDGSIIKTKDMLSCRNRQGVNSAVQSIGYGDESNIQSLAIMKTTYTCTQVIQQNILGSSTCIEKHIFRPFSNGDSGASTVNVQTLKFVETKNGGKAKEDEISVRSDLLFSHQFSESSNKNAGKNIEMKLQTLCKISKVDVRPEQPQVFSELIKAMKLADIDTLNGIYKQINSQVICPANTEKIKKIFHDAIPMVGTGSSLQLIGDLIGKGEVTGLEKNMWLASLPFIQNPTKEMLSAVKPLLEDKNAEGHTIHMISNLMSGYCSVNPKCEDVSEFIELLDVFDRYLGKCIFAEQYEKTLNVLRAVGNIGHVKKLIPRMVLCVSGYKIPTRTKVAAIDAFRKLPCDVDRSDILHVFTDTSKDPELRITAYLALMKCPNKQLVDSVKELLSTEKNNQTGSFVWTHLTNLKESSDTHLQELRAILENRELKMEFDSDKRKFSRNYASSFFLDAINAGGKVDGNVIVAEKSFVPRSANLNLNIDLFGREINFFEFGSRIEGVEKFLQRYFGDNGYFKRKVPPTPSQLMPFLEHLDPDTGDLKGYVYMRMFGNEIAFQQFQDPDFSMLKNVDIKKWMNNDKIAFQKNLALMDTQLIVPTIIGLPLNLTVAAMASIDFEATGKLNLASLKNIEIGASIKPSAAVKVIGEMTVDAFATKAGLRMNSLSHSSTEAKLSFNMKNGQLVESKFELPKKKMEIITFTSDYAIVKGDMVKAQNMLEDKLTNQKCTGETFNKVTGLKLCSQVILPGASMKQNAPSLPLTGPVVMKIELINHDAPEGLIMRTHYNKATQSGFIIDTPNSKLNRKISLDIDINNQNQTIEIDSPWKKVAFNGKFARTQNTKLISGELILDNKNYKVDKYSASLQLDSSSNNGEFKWVPKMVIMTPAKKMTIDGTITSSEEQVEADLRVAGLFREELTFKMSAVSSKTEYSCISTIGVGYREYYLKTKIGKLPKGNAMMYSPELLLKADGKELIKFDASILYNPNSKIIFNFKLDKVFSKIVALNTRVLMNSSAKKMKHQLMFNLKAPKVVIDIKGLMELRESRFTSRLITAYNIGKYSDKLTISTKFFDESTDSLALYSGDLAVNSKKDLKNNFVVKCRIGKGDSHLETKFDLEVGNPKNNPEKIFFESMLHFNLKSMKKVVKYTVSFERPSKNLNVGLKLSHVNLQNKRFETDVEVKNGPSLMAGAKVQFAMNPNSYEGFVSVRHFEKEVFRFEDKLTSKSPQEYKNYLNIIVPDGTKVTLETVFEKESDTSYYLRNTLNANTKEITLINRLNADRTNFSLYTEIDADAHTITSYACNPNFSFGYNYQTSKGSLVYLKFGFDYNFTPEHFIIASYTFRFPSHTILQDVSVKTSYNNTREVVVQHRLKLMPYFIQLHLYLYVDDHCSAQEKYNIIWDDDRFFLDFKLSRVSSGDLIEVHVHLGAIDSDCKVKIKYGSWFLNIDSDMELIKHPNTMDLKMKVYFNIPRRKFTYTMKHDSSLNKVEGLLTSNGEFKVEHPGTHFELKYDTRVEANKIHLVTDFMSTTFRHRNSKLDIDIAMNDDRTSVTAKANVDYNSEHLCKVDTDYKYNDLIHNCHVAINFPNGEIMTTVFNVGMSESKKTIHAEVKCPQHLGLLEMNMDGYAQCQEGNNCNVQMSLKTNSFIKDMEVAAEIDSNGWSKRSLQASVNINGDDKLKFKGGYDVADLKNCFAELEVMSKIGRTDDKLVFIAKRESAKGTLEISGMMEHFGHKYGAEFLGKAYEEIKIKVFTPNFYFEPRLLVNKFRWNDFDVLITAQFNARHYRLIVLDRLLEEVKLSLALANFEVAEILYTGGIDGQKMQHKLKTSYGEYFIENALTLDMDDQFELKSNVQVLIGNDKITWSSLVKNTGKINMDICLKTPFDISGTLQAQIEPDMYNADLSLVVDTKWTGEKKLTYSHSGQKGAPLQINADLGNGKKSDYTLSAKISTIHPHGLTMVLTDKMANRYMFDGEVTASGDMLKSKLLLEAPFEFMAGKPVEIMFEKAGPIISSSGSFGIMEYSTNLEHSPQRAILKNYINWNTQDKASNFKFEITSVGMRNKAVTDKIFAVKLIHPTRSVSFSTKFGENFKLLDLDVGFSSNVGKGQNAGFRFGKEEGTGYVQLSLPERTYKLAGRLDRENERTVFSSSFFWNLNVDDSKKIDLIMTLTQRKSNAVFDTILKFPSQTKGLRLKSELIWQRGDTLFNSKTEFSFNQDPANIFTAQTELLKDDNNKYTLMMALMHPSSNTDMLTTICMFELDNKLTASMDMKNGMTNFHSEAYFDKNNKEISLKVQSPSYTADISGQPIDEHDYGMTAKIVEGAGQPMEANIIFDPTHATLTIQVNGDMPEKIDVSILTNNMVISKVNRSSVAEDTAWIPHTIYELNEYMYVNMLNSMQTMNPVNIYATMVEEGKLITTAVHKACLSEISALEKDISEIADETRQWRRTINEVYERDYLYLSTIAKNLGTGFYEVQSNLVKAVSYAVYQLRQAFTNYYGILLEKMSEENHEVKEFYRMISYDVDLVKSYVMQNPVMKFVSNCISYLGMIINGIIESLNDLMDVLKTYPVIGDIFAMSNEVYQQLVWAYNYFEVEETTKSLDDQVKNYFTKTEKQVFSKNQMELILFDLRRGDIELRFPLVVPKDIAQSDVRFDQLVGMVKATINKFNQFQPEYNYTVSDVFKGFEGEAKEKMFEADCEELTLSANGTAFDAGNTLIIPQSSPLSLPGKLFQGNFQINENLKEELNKYWNDIHGQVISGSSIPW